MEYVAKSDIIFLYNRKEIPKKSSMKGKKVKSKKV